MSKSLQTYVKISLERSYNCFVDFCENCSLNYTKSLSGLLWDICFSGQNYSQINRNAEWQDELVWRNIVLNRRNFNFLFHWVSTKTIVLNKIDFNVATWYTLTFKYVRTTIKFSRIEIFKNWWRTFNKSENEEIQKKTNSPNDNSFQIEQRRGKEMTLLGSSIQQKF